MIMGVKLVKHSGIQCSPILSNSPLSHAVSTASAAFYQWGAGFACQLLNCSGIFVSHVHRHSSCKEGSAGLATLLGVLRVSLSRTSFCHQRFSRGAVKPKAGWRRRRPRSRETWNPTPDRVASATHDGERIGWKSLASSHRANPPRVNSAINTNEVIDLVWIPRLSPSNMTQNHLLYKK